MKPRLNIAIILGMMAASATAADVSLSGGDISYSGESVSHSTKDATVLGGAVSSETQVSISGATSISFKNNSATNSYTSSHTTKNADIAAGGAIYGGTVTVSGNNGPILFEGNTIRMKTTNDARSRVRGGAIKGGSVSISNNTGESISFSGNSAYDNYKAWDESVGAQVDKPKFSSGGAIYADTELSISGNSGASISFSNNQAGKGGAISSGYNSSMTLTGNGDVSFTGNVAQYGGAAYTGCYVYLNSSNTAGYASLSITGNSSVSFSNNMARNNGGAIYNQVNSRVSINSNKGDVSFTGNSAVLYGGAVRGQSGSTVEFNQNSGTVSFSGNKVSRTDITNVYGGAISVDNNSTVNMDGNGAVSLISNSLQTNSSAYGGAISIYNSTLSISGNKQGVTISNNTVTATKTSSWENGVEANGGAVYGKAMRIENNSGEVLISGNKATAVTDGTAKGGAFYVHGSLTISGNDKVVFRNNLEDSAGSTILRSVYLESNTTDGALTLSAKEGGSITFYDSLYADTSGSQYSLTTSFNQESTDTGTITFSGKYAQSDLLVLNPDATAEMIEASRTSTIMGSVTLGYGTLSLQDDARLVISGGLTVGSSATLEFLRTPEAAITPALISVSGEGDAPATSAATLSADLTLEDGATLNLSNGTIDLDGNDLVLNGDVSINIEGAPLEAGKYVIFTNVGNMSIEDETAFTITLNGKQTEAMLSSGNLVAFAPSIPEPATATLSLLALAALAVRRRRSNH